jgi:hypothetical protein
MRIMTNNKNVKGGAEELDKYLSTMITTLIDLEQQVELFQKQYTQHAGNPFKPQPQGTRSATRSQSSGGGHSVNNAKKNKCL